METNRPSWSVQRSCDSTLRWAKRRLASGGLRALQTFDLRDARLATSGCPCPYHGTADCDCQMVVLLVYSGVRAPVTLVIHGNGVQSWISVTDRPDQCADSATVSDIHAALQAAAET